MKSKLKRIVSTMLFFVLISVTGIAAVSPEKSSTEGMSATSKYPPISELSFPPRNEGDLRRIYVNQIYVAFFGEPFLIDFWARVGMWAQGFTYHPIYYDLPSPTIPGTVSYAPAVETSVAPAAVEVPAPAPTKKSVLKKKKVSTNRHREVEK